VRMYFVESKSNECTLKFFVWFLCIVKCMKRGAEWVKKWAKERFQRFCVIDCGTNQPDIWGLIAKSAPHSLSATRIKLVIKLTSHYCSRFSAAKNTKFCHKYTNIFLKRYNLQLNCVGGKKIINMKQTMEFFCFIVSLSISVRNIYSITRSFIYSTNSSGKKWAFWHINSFKKYFTLSTL